MNQQIPNTAEGKNSTLATSPKNNLHQAVYDKITTNVKYLEAISSNSVQINYLKWAHYKYSKVRTGGQPLFPKDILIPRKRVLRSCILTLEEEIEIYDTANYFADMCTFLPPNDLCDLFQRHIKLLLLSKQVECKFKNNRFSSKWVTKFLKRHSSTTYKCRKCIESKRITAITKDDVATFIGCINSAEKRYKVRDCHRIFKFDECSISILRISFNGLCKGMGYKEKYLVTRGVNTKEMLDYATILAIVSG